MKSVCPNCDAPIRWVQAINGGDMMLDVQPVATGEIVVEPSLRGADVAVVLKGHQLKALHPDVPRWRNHLETCEAVKR